MKWFFGLLGVTRIHSSWYLKNKYWWAGSLIYPLSFFVVLTVVGGAKMANHSIIGAIISLLWMSGVGSMPQILFSYKFIKLQDMFVAAPVHPLTYMLGAAFSVLVSSLPPMIVLIMLFNLYIHVTAAELIYFVLILLVAWLTSSCLGFVIAGYVNDPTQIGTIAPWAGALLTSLPPVYYPLEALPPQIQVVAILAPTTHLAQIAKLTVRVASPLYDTLFHILVITAYLITFILLASFKSQWRQKE